jgi:hypothetical protein
MTKPRVYVETTIPSFFHDPRTVPDIAARREWTRQWWSDAAARYELVTSPAVLDELANGPPEHSGAWLTFLRDLPLLPVEPAIAEIIQATFSTKSCQGTPLATRCTSRWRLITNATFW